MCFLLKTGQAGSSTLPLPTVCTSSSVRYFFSLSQRIFSNLFFCALPISCSKYCWSGVFFHEEVGRVCYGRSGRVFNHPVMLLQCLPRDWPTMVAGSLVYYASTACETRKSGSISMRLLGVSYVLPGCVSLDRAHGKQANEETGRGRLRRRSSDYGGRGKNDLWQERSKWLSRQGRIDRTRFHTRFLSRLLNGVIDRWLDVIFYYFSLPFLQYYWVIRMSRIFFMSDNVALMISNSFLLFNAVEWVPCLQNNEKMREKILDWESCRWNEEKFYLWLNFSFPLRFRSK